MELITSPRNPRVKNVIKLRDRKGRARQGRILIDGQRCIRAAIENGWPIEELFVRQQDTDPADDDSHAALSDDAQYVLGNCKASGVPIYTVPEHVLARMGYGGRSDQWIATSQAPDTSLSQLTIPDNHTSPLIAILECFEKPGNVGAVLRSADAAGVTAVILVDGHTDLLNPNAIRASQGTLFSTSIAQTTRQACQAWLEDRQIRTFVARVDGSKSYHQSDLTGACAIVLGNEASGVSDAWRRPTDQAIRLPMLGHADSLNVSNAAAILFYESQRQRGRLDATMRA